MWGFLIFLLGACLAIYAGGGFMVFVFGVAFMIYGGWKVFEWKCRRDLKERDKVPRPRHFTLT
jgi:hypothetical protein